MRAALIGAIVAALVTLPGLGIGTLWDNSETAYGEVAREVLLFHDWVVLHLNGAAWFVQPPLYFWIAAAFAKLFGVGTFALRLPSALATIGTSAVTAYVVARHAGERAGIYAGVILATALMEAVVGRLAIMDALLDLSVAVAVLCWFEALEGGSDGALIAGFVAVAFGFLAKGPVAPAIAALVIVPFACWNARLSRIAMPSRRGWVIGIGAALLVAAPWFVAIASRAGTHALVVLIGHYTFGRYVGTIENQSGPVWYYLPVLVLGFFPWIAFLPSAITYGLAALRRPVRSDEDVAVQALMRLAFCWAIVPFVFFSLAKTKLPNYIALEMPALALIAALYFDETVRKARSLSILVSSAVVPITIALVAIAVVVFSRDNRLTGDLQSVARDLVFVGGAVFVGSVVTFALALRQTSRAAAPYVLAAATTLAILFLALLALPAAETFKPVPRLAGIIERERRASDLVAIQNVSGGNALLFYTRPHVYVLAPPDRKSDDDGIDPRSVICAAPHVWVVAPIARPVYDPTYGRLRQTIATSGRAQLFLYSGRCAA